MKVAKLLPVALGLGLALQAAETCPVSLSAVKRDTGLGDKSTYCFSLDVVNNTAQPANEIILHAAAYTSDRQRHTLKYDYPVANLKPGERRNVYFSTHRLLGTDYSGIKVWVSRISYKDNSSWNDDGTLSCHAQDVKK